MRARRNGNGLHHFLSATGHSNQRLLYTGRLLNYECLGGGETGGKEVD